MKLIYILNHQNVSLELGHHKRIRDSKLLLLSLHYNYQVTANFWWIINITYSYSSTTCIHSLCVCVCGNIGYMFIFQVIMYKICLNNISSKQLIHNAHQYNLLLLSLIRHKLVTHAIYFFSSQFLCILLLVL